MFASSSSALIASQSSSKSSSTIVSDEQSSKANSIEILTADSTTDDEFDIIIQSGSDTEEEVVVVEQASTKKRGKKAEYVLEKTCNSFTEAKADVESRGFGKTDSKAVRGGYNHFFRCKAAKKRGDTKCPKTMKIFESNTDKEIIIYSSDAVHEHDVIADQDKSKKMSPEMRSFIVNQRKKNMNAKNIIKSINEMRQNHDFFLDEPTPTAKQIYYVSERQISIEAPQMISVGDLVEWCEKNRTIPIDEDAAYIIGYEHSNEDEFRFFRFMLSTQRLLKNCVDVTTLVIDATYKLNWQGYPFLIVGTVDRNRKFHALAYACTTNEKTEDYTFFFQSLIDAVKQLYDAQIMPKTLIADGAITIRKACELTLPSVEVMVMCYVHVLRNEHWPTTKRIEKS